MSWTIRLAASENNIRISSYMHERKIREALEINILRTINDEMDKTFTALNKDKWLLRHDEFLETSFHENGKPLNCSL